MSKFLLTVSKQDIAGQITELLRQGDQLFHNPSPNSILMNAIQYVVELDGAKVVGCIGLEIKHPHTDMTELKHLCVHPDYRNRGLGLKLLKKGIEYAQTPYVFGTIRSTNEVNIRNNYRAGMRPVCQYKGQFDYNLIIFATKKSRRN